MEGPVDTLNKFDPFLTHIGYKKFKLLTCVGVKMNKSFQSIQMRGDLRIITAIQPTIWGTNVAHYMKTRTLSEGDLTSPRFMIQHYPSIGQK